MAQLERRCLHSRVAVSKMLTVNSPVSGKGFPDFSGSPLPLLPLRGRGVRHHLRPGEGAAGAVAGPPAASP